MKYEKLPLRSLVFWEVAGGLFYGLLALLVWILIPAYYLIWYALLWLMGALFVLTSFLYLPLLYLNVAYSVEPDRIFLKSGVIFTKNYIMMRDKVSFVTVYSTPMDYFLKLSGLVVSAPGSRMMILFMDKDRAEEIAEKMNEDMLYVDQEKNRCG